MSDPQKARILREATSGLDEWGDVLVCLSPGGENSGVHIEIKSTLLSMFGDQIRATVLGVDCFMEVQSFFYFRWTFML